MFSKNLFTNQMAESNMLKMVQSKNPDKEYPSNLGLKWTSCEEQQLLSSIEEGLDMETIAKQHNRSLGGIQSRIRIIAYEMSLQQVPMEQIMKRTGFSLQEINTVISRKQTEKTCKKTTVTENQYHCVNSGITLEIVHQEVQTMKHEMKELKNNIKELIELIQAIYEFSEE